jgi:hypothetical protein
MTRNEARATQNLPAIEGGDELIVPLNVVEGGQASPQDSAPDTGALSGRPGIKALRQGGRRPLAKVAPELTDGQMESGVELFRSFFKRQRRAVLSAIGAGGDWWDAERWNAELSADLEGLAVELSAGIGKEQAKALGFGPEDYDVKRTLAFMGAVAASRAEWVNAATEQKLRAVLDSDEDDEDAPGPDSVFDEAEDVRSGSAGRALVTTAASFAMVEAGKQLGGDKAVKTWRVTSGNPRPEHAAMDGETVPIGEEFSNGLNWPGDPVMGPDEVAGCECTVDVSVE